MKSQSAQKKQHELAQANAVAQAQLATPKANQAQTARVNWEQNQVMQASAKQAVVTQVTQSQLNKDFWAAYALWKAKAMLAEARRRAQQLAKQQKMLIASQNSKPKPPAPTTPNPFLALLSRVVPSVKKVVAGLGMVALLSAGGSVQQSSVGVSGGGSGYIDDVPSQSRQNLINCQSEVQYECAGGRWLDGVGPSYYPSTGEEVRGYINSPVAQTFVNVVYTAFNVTNAIVQSIQSMTPMDWLILGLSIAFEPVDLAYNGFELFRDAVQGNLGWHSVFNLIPFASVGMRQLDNFNVVDNTINPVDEAILSPNISGSRNWQVENSVVTNRIPNQSQINSCASACGVNALQRYGIDLTESDVMRYVDTDGLDMITFDRLVNGLNNAVTDLSDSPVIFNTGIVDDINGIAYLTQNNRVVIANLAQRAVVVESVDFINNTVRILDPWGMGAGSGIAYESIMSIERFVELQRFGRFQIVYSTK